MRKIIKIFFEVIATISLTVVVLFLIVSLLLQFNFAQSRVRGEISNFLSEKLDVKVSLGGFKLKFFNEFVVTDLFVENPYQKSDTLLHVNRLDLAIGVINIKNRTFNVRNAEVKGGYLNIESDSSLNINIKSLVDKIRDKDKAKKENSFTISVANVMIDSFAMAYSREIKRYTEIGVNYDDMRFNNLKINAKNFILMGDSIHFTLKHASFIEKSGMELNRFTADSVVVSPSLIFIADASLTADRSRADIKNFSLHYSDWVLADFIHNVEMDGRVKDSYIRMATVERLSGKVRNWNTDFTMSGDFKGTVDDLSCNVAMLNVGSSSMMGSTIRLVGLPDVNETTFHINLRELKSNNRDICNITSDFMGREFSNEFISRVGDVTLMGLFDGKIDNFVSNGKISSYNGDVKFIVSNVRKRDEFNIKGSVVASNVNGEEIFKVKSLRDVNLSGDVDCSIGAKNIRVDLNSTIKSLKYNGYKYTGINVNGLFDNREFVGDMSSDDENFNFVFGGKIDINGDTPQYDFNLDIKHADLFALNFDKRDSVSLFSGEIIAVGGGTQIDDFNGSVEFNDFKFINRVDTVEIGNIEFVAKNSEQNKFLTMKSDFVDINIAAKQSYRDIIPYFKSTITKYLPALQRGELNLAGFNKKIVLDSNSGASAASAAAEDSYYVATINVKETNNIASIISPGLNIAKDSKLSFVFNPMINEFSFSAKSDSITNGRYWVKNLDINSKSVADSVSIFVDAGKLNLGAVYMPNLKILGGVKDNNIALSSRFVNPADTSNALLAVKTQFLKETRDNSVRMVAEILPSYIALSDTRWNLSSENIIIDSSRIDISNLELKYRDQKVLLNGVVSKSPSDTLRLGFDHFELDGFSKFVSKIGYKIQGDLNGSAKMYRRGRSYGFSSNLSIDSLFLNDYRVPNLKIESEEEGNSVVRYNIFTANREIVNAWINYATFKFKSSVKINDIDLSPLEPMLSVIGYGCSGVADIDIELDNFNRPLNINGAAIIKDLRATIDYTKVRYKLGGRIEVKDNVYKLVDGTVEDSGGVSAPLTASLDGGDRYHRVRYKIGVEPQGLMCLNTTLDDNSLFYGDVWGSGTMEVEGYGTNVKMSISAAAVNNSRFYMPLSDKLTISEADFITFVEPKKEKIEGYNRSLINFASKSSSSTSHFEMDINMSASNDTEVQLVIDPMLGDIIKARGNGELRMRVVPNDNTFTLTGGYEISEGSYLFTLPNFKLLNKYFIIKPGSTINWTGDPLAANLNVTAVYQTKTSLSPLLGVTYSRAVDVDCNLSLTGQLMKPDITLGISVPDVDPETQSLLSSYLNTEESISKQIFWLLFSNSFYADASQQSGTNVTVGMMQTAGAVTGIEFLSNQISNWISTDKFNLGFNYRPRGDVTSDELEFNISAPLLDNRLLLEAEGNYDFKNNSTYLTGNSKTVSGNFYLTYLLDKKGNLQTKAFTRSIDSFDENQGLQESGVGIYYRDSFDKISGLKHRFKEALEKRRKRRAVRDSLENLYPLEKLEKLEGFEEAEIIEPIELVKFEPIKSESIKP